MQQRRGRNSRWRPGFLSLAVALGCTAVVDAVVYVLPNAHVYGIRLGYVIVIGAAVLVMLMILILSLRRPSSRRAQAVKVGTVEMKSGPGSFADPDMAAAILTAVMIQLHTTEELQVSMAEQRRQQAELQDDLRKLAGDFRAAEQGNLRIQLFLAASTTLIGLAGSLVLVLLTTPSGG